MAESGKQWGLRDFCNETSNYLVGMSECGCAAFLTAIATLRSLFAVKGHEDRASASDNLYLEELRLFTERIDDVALAVAPVPTANCCRAGELLTVSRGPPCGVALAAARRWRSAGLTFSSFAVLRFSFQYVRHIPLLF